MLVFMFIVGAFGYYGMSNSNNQISSITHQLEIAKDVNRGLVDAQDAQANSLRYIIYKSLKVLN